MATKIKGLLLRGLLPALLLSACAFALAACGGSGGGDDEAKAVEQTIEKSLVEPTPADCKTHETQKFMEQTTHSEGAEALKACEAEGSGTKDEEIAVSAVAVKGADATAHVGFTGGSFDGQTLSLALTKKGDNWQLDEITGFAKLDKGKLVAAIDAQLASALKGVPAKAAECIKEAINKAPSSALTELLLKGNGETVTKAIEGCAKSLAG